MNTQEITNYELFIEIHQLEHLKFEKINGEYMVTLIDDFEYEIVKGYGKTIIEAINDLHNSLV